jgi:DNA topoisomerase-1
MPVKSGKSCRDSIEGGYVLVISEKPKAGAAISRALYGDSIECREAGVPYWIVRNGKRTYVIASTAGHLFTLSTRKRGFPVFDYEWVPRWEAERGAGHLKKFYGVLSKLAKGASLYINACDYDIEGSVIGYMIIKMLGNGSKALRMKYSSLAEEELRSAFSSPSEMDWEMVEAGICRHELDWIWGINLSRLLSWITSLIGEKKNLSSGRVQSPTLVEAVERYVDYLTFISAPKFSLRAELSAHGEKFPSTHVRSPFERRQEALERKQRIMEEKVGEVVKVERSSYSLRPPPAFNLSELQYEASRIYGFSPSYTQRLAEELYLDALISYPRTNSEKLPPTIPHRKILAELSSFESYRSFTAPLLKSSRLSPAQGVKEDPAHPAIYPTGKKPSGIRGDAFKVYDLIARRYIAAFMDEAIIERRDFRISVGGEELEAQGRVIEKAGWTRAYPFSVGKERSVALEEGEKVEVLSTKIEAVFQGKPKLHTKTSLLKWMEGENIGTEATRAQIIETLFKRGYLVQVGKEVRPTKLGIAVALFLKEKFPEITKTELTRKFEERLLKIREGKEERAKVVGEAKSFLEVELSRAMDLKEELGKFMKMYLAPENRCELCDLPQLEGGLCLVHQRALQRLADSLEEWERAFGEDREKVLKRMAKSSSVGRAVREIARWIIEKRLIL